MFIAPDLEAAIDETTGEILEQDVNCPQQWRFIAEVALSCERAFFNSDTPKTRRIALRSGTVRRPETGGAFDLCLEMVVMD